jgi:glycosyltransferase involved in cell wall biosynthesis
MWSVMIPVYNCAQYLRETLESVLQQGYSPQQMQIEVVDDASTDADVESLVLAVGKGRIGYFRHQSNVGSLRNFETCINRSQGDLIHILHGDDKVRMGFYRKLESLFKLSPEVGAAFCRYSYINAHGENLFLQNRELEADGILQEWLPKIAEYQRVQYAAIAVKREVYEKLGSFYGVTYGEDWEMWVRIARNYQVAYTPTVLAEYRKHAISISGQKLQNAQLLKDIRRVISLIKEHLPQEHRWAVMHKSKKYYANFAVVEANVFWEGSHDKQAVRAQLREALLTNYSTGVLWNCIKLYAKTLMRR